MQTTMKEFVAATADGHGVPGLAVGVWDNGRQLFFSHGVTSVENPLPVDEDNLFPIGSVTKTFTVAPPGTDGPTTTPACPKPTE